MKKKEFLRFLKEKANFIRKQTIKFHLAIPETRIASSLSCIEILVTLYYGKIFNFKNDRIVISKGHGAISLYPILIDLGFLKNIKIENKKSLSLLGSIPDINLPTINLINGSLGHGLGQGCGIAIAMRMRKLNGKIFVLIGDGELYEGSCWEAIMFAGHHRLDNLIVIVDNNKISMLDYCKKIINLEPLDKKFQDFGFESKSINGHNILDLYNTLTSFKKSSSKRPKLLIANTIKGKGVAKLEKNPLCHIMSLEKKDVKEILDKKL
ncbi:MAG: thiamine pyrophosphate-dependent enzyme [Candidatus Omnitrophica bacterium]|nr:thiamine pyrophosphate-dependent enzyme [Candidatus Omnitrophota bacterium]